jgi:hypothetical protein
MIQSLNDCEHFATGGDDKTIKIYSLKTLKLKTTLIVKRKKPFCIETMSDKNLMAVGGYNMSKFSFFGKKTARRNIKFYSTKNFKYIFKYKINVSESTIIFMRYCC